MLFMIPQGLLLSVHWYSRSCEQSISKIPHLAMVNLDDRSNRWGGDDDCDEDDEEEEGENDGEDDDDCDED